MKYNKKVKWIKEYGWYLVFINGMIGISMTSAFPQFTMVVGDLSKQMNTSEEFLLFTDTVKAFAIMGGMFCSGIVYNKMGLRNTFILSLICMVGPQIAFPFVTHAVLVIPLKIIQGFASLIFPIFIIIIMEWIEESQMGIATAVFNGIFYGGAGIGAAASGIIISEFGWKASFFGSALMTLIPGIIWIMTVKEKGLGEAPRQGEKTEGIHPFLDTIKKPYVWLLVLCFISTIWMLQVLTVDLPLWNRQLGYNSSQSGMIMSSVTIGILMATLVSGRTSDFLSARRENKGVARLQVMMAGPVITIAVIVMLYVIDLRSFPMFYGAILMLSFGSAWGLGAFYCILPELLKARILKFATGFIGGAADIAMPIGPFVVGVIFGIKGMWGLAGASCIAVAGLSALGCLLIIVMMKRKSPLNLS